MSLTILIPSQTTRVLIAPIPTERFKLHAGTAFHARELPLVYYLLNPIVANRMPLITAPPTIDLEAARQLRSPHHNMA
jgi:hypothetical protein